MANSKRKQSTIGTFGSIVIALGIALGLIMSNIYVAASGISAGIFILLIACIVDRLDIVIDLLQQIGEQMPDFNEGKDPEDVKKQP